MLVLTRKLHERIKIFTSDGEIIVEITAILGNKIRLGFEAPKNIKISREKVEIK